MDKGHKGSPAGNPPIEQTARARARQTLKMLSANLRSRDGGHLDLDYALGFAAAIDFQSRPQRLSIVVKRIGALAEQLDMAIAEGRTLAHNARTLADLLAEGADAAASIGGEVAANWQEQRHRLSAVAENPCEDPRGQRATVERFVLLRLAESYAFLFGEKPGFYSRSATDLPLRQTNWHVYLEAALTLLGISHAGTSIQDGEVETRPLARVDGALKRLTPEQKEAVNRLTKAQGWPRGRRGFPKALNVVAHALARVLDPQTQLSSEAILRANGLQSPDLRS